MRRTRVAGVGHHDIAGARTVQAHPANPLLPGGDHLYVDPEHPVRCHPEVVEGADVPGREQPGVTGDEIESPQLAVVGDHHGAAITGPDHGETLPSSLFRTTEFPETLGGLPGLLGRCRHQ